MDDRSLNFFKLLFVCFFKFIHNLSFFSCNFIVYTRIMVTIKKRAGVIPYSFSSSIALLSSLLSSSFYLLDLRTISSVDILEMTLKDGKVLICPYYGHLPGL